jgi:RNA-directed DNA polymerase
MPYWRPQFYESTAQQRSVDPTVLQNAQLTASLLLAKSHKLAPVLSLRHLAHCSGADYGYLRAVVERSCDNAYRFFKIRKRCVEGEPVRYRLICVPSPHLMQTQRWIVEHILAHLTPHECSVAYTKGSTLRDAASRHCGARWLIKLDLLRFFESINEISAYRVFHAAGYQKLVSFELARLCTRLRSSRPTSQSDKWRTWPGRALTIRKYFSEEIGHLPQGAPTSPMLANMVSIGLDQDMQALSDDFGLRYSRYADDLTFSTDSKSFTRSDASRLIGLAYGAFGRYGFSPNKTKTTLVPPGARKLVLGVLVDGDVPRLTREFKSLLRQHLYYLEKAGVGPAAHARNRGFASVGGFRNHMFGLLAYSKQIDPALAQAYRERLEAVAWPI